MPELLKTMTSMGTLTVEQGPAGLLVKIHRLGFNKMFGKDKVVSVEHGIGGGSVMFTHTVKIHLLGGETVVLKNVPSKNADALQQLLS